MLLVDLMPRIFLDEGRQLLDRGNDDMCFRAFQLAFQKSLYWCWSLLRPSQSGHIPSSSGSPNPCGLPQTVPYRYLPSCWPDRAVLNEVSVLPLPVCAYEAPAFHRAILLVVGRYPYLLQNTFRSGNLVRPHHQEQFLGSKHTIFGQDIQQCMFGKERSREVHQIRNNLIIPSGPVAGKLKAVAGLVLTFRLVFLLLFCNVRNAGSITVVLGLRTVADDKYLHVFKQSASGPETFPGCSAVSG
mgnify:CR=1 FL=1